MSACEKCWSDACKLGGDISDNYRELLLQRKETPCSPKERAGQWWDEDKQIDIRSEIDNK